MYGVSIEVGPSFARHRSKEAMLHAFCPPLIRRGRQRVHSTSPRGRLGVRPGRDPTLAALVRNPAVAITSDQSVRLFVLRRGEYDRPWTRDTLLALLLVGGNQAILSCRTCR
jgi:hypothetical protein